MNAVVKQKFNIWMACHPDSCHPLDKERFMDFIKEANKRNSLEEIRNMNLYHEVKTYHPQWCEEYVVEFVEEWSKRIIHEVDKCEKRRNLNLSKN